MKVQESIENIEKTVSAVLGEGYSVEVTSLWQHFSLYIKGDISVILNVSKWDETDDDWQTAENIAAIVAKTFGDFKKNSLTNGTKSGILVPELKRPK